VYSEGGELSRRLAAPAVEMEDALARQVRERVTHLRGQAAFPSESFRPAAVELVPGAAVVLGRLHQASRE
jgi:hypothetical protein